jgi:chromosome segregation ATPase
MQCGPDGKLRWALCCSVLVLVAAGLRADPAKLTGEWSSLKNSLQLVNQELRDLKELLATQSAELKMALLSAEKAKTESTTLYAELTGLSNQLADLNVSIRAERNRLKQWKAAAIMGWTAAAVGWVLAALAFAF